MKGRSEGLAVVTATPSKHASKAAPSNNEAEPAARPKIEEPKRCSPPNSRSMKSSERKAGIVRKKTRRSKKRAQVKSPDTDRNKSNLLAIHATPEESAVAAHRQDANPVRDAANTEGELNEERSGRRSDGNRKNRRAGGGVGSYLAWQARRRGQPLPYYCCMRME